MSSVSDNAVCIRRWRYSETSQTVVLFGEEHGLFRGLAKGATRPRGKYSGGFDLLTRGQVMAIIRPERELANITEWHLEEPYPALRRSIIANRTALYIADLVGRMLEPHDPHPSLFTAMVDALDALADDALAPAALLRFQTVLLGETGHQPELNRNVETGRAFPDSIAPLAFSARLGGLVADTGDAERWRVRRETVALLTAMQHDEHAPEADRAVFDRANRLLGFYIREILGSAPPTMAWLMPEKRRR